MEAWGDVEADAHRALHASDEDNAPPSGRRSLVDSAEAAVRDWLAPGHYRRGDRLPPEYELAAMLGISRGTLRSALRRLELTGEIVRRQGSGTFVGRVPATGGLGPERARVAAWSPRSRLPELTIEVASVAIEQRAAGERAAESLDISRRERTTVITRELAVDGCPSALSRDVFHPRINLLPTEEMHRMLSGGIKTIDVLQANDTAMSFSRATITPRLLGPDDAEGRQLALTEPTACLQVEEVMFDAFELPMVYSCELFTPRGIQIEVLQSVDAPHPVPVTARRRPSTTTAAVHAAREAAPTRVRS